MRSRRFASSARRCRGSLPAPPLPCGAVLGLPSRALFFQLFYLPVFVKCALEFIQLAIRYFINPFRERVDEISVVRYEEQRPSYSLSAASRLSRAGRSKVVSRFVKKQYVIAPAH